MNARSRQPPRGHRSGEQLPRLLHKAEQARRQGSIATAGKHLQKATKLAPADPRAYLQLARLQQDQGRLHESLKTYQACLRQQPETVEALINMGMLYKRCGQPDQAIACYEKAMALRNDIAEIPTNLGNAWLDKGEHDRAEAAYQQAISRHARFAGGWHNLGRLYLQQNRLAEALPMLRQARQLAPDSWQIRADLADCLSQLPLNDPDPALAGDLLACLTLSRIDGRALGRATARYLVRQVYAHALEALQAGTLRVDAPLLASLQQPLLISLLQREPLCHWTLEQLLTEVRRQCLLQADTLTPETSPLLAALAQQCFLNEYLWPCSADEDHTLAQLAEELREQPVTAADNHPRLCLYACYRPLAECIDADQAESLLPQAPEYWAQLLRQQILEPAAETAIKAELPCLTPIDDDTSQAVQAQYEANPYPRWRMLDAPPVQTLTEYLCLLFPRLRRNPPAFPARPAILAAGCGTGLQALRMARRIPDADITAVDISRASLAYGRRQAQAHGHEDIRFAQADILRLDASAGQFDAIECYGVLHHMSAPEAGWRVLRQRLKPGGVMRIGLYSHAARGPIRAVRELIDEWGIAPDKAGIRQVREHIAALPADDPLHQLCFSPDFYTVSECRDLMFHVQEQQLDPGAIATILERLQLEFLGFEFDDYAILNTYRDEYPQDTHATDLSNWQAFESRHPDSFASQYIFWVRDSQ